MNKLPSLSFVIPCYNNSATIANAITEALRVGPRVAKRFEICIIDDGSSDKSLEKIRSFIKRVKQLKILTHSINRGYGQTIKELYYKASSAWLFSIPGDYQVGAEEIIKLLPSVSQADMIIGWRISRQDPGGRIVQSRIYNTLLQLFFGINIHDVNSVRLMKTSLLKEVKLASKSAFVDAELAIKAKHSGFKVLEVPIDHRQDSTKGGGGSWRTILPTIVDMIRFKLGVL